MCMIYIVCNIDNNYTEQCGLMLLSLLSHNPQQRFTVYIINNRVCEANKDRLYKLTSHFGLKINFCDVSHSLIEKFPIKEDDHLSLATYLRIFMSELLPENIDKVLYLDCDLMVIDSIKDLWETDMEDFAVAAVEERPPFDTISPETLGYPTSYSYFNAGVMLINLKYWREMDLSSKCQKFIQENRQIIQHHDQDVLNALLHDKRKFISIRWNLMDFFMFTQLKIQENRLPDLYNSFKQPAINHFTAKRKPWAHNCDSPFRNHYIRLAKQYSCNVMVNKDSIHYHLRHFWFKLMTYLHLRKKQILSLSDLKKINK